MTYPALFECSMRTNFPINPDKISIFNQNIYMVKVIVTLQSKYSFRKRSPLACVESADMISGKKIKLFLYKSFFCINLCLNDVAPYLTLVMTTKLITHDPEGVDFCICIDFYVNYKSVLTSFIRRWCERVELGIRIYSIL